MTVKFTKENDLKALEVLSEIRKTFSHFDVPSTVLILLDAATVEMAEHIKEKYLPKNKTNAFLTEEDFDSFVKNVLINKPYPPNSNNKH
jgi:hypothetical protein